MIFRLEQNDQFYYKSNTVVDPRIHDHFDRKCSILSKTYNTFYRYNHVILLAFINYIIPHANKF